MMTPSKFLSNACPQTREAAVGVQIEHLKAGDTIVIADNAWGPTSYVIHDIEALYDGAEFVITYGTESGRWTDTVSFEAGEMVNAERQPATLSDVTSIVCADILSGSLGSYGKVAAE